MLADIPGLIEGAHEGAGLGNRFLGHVERCAVLLHLIDGAAGDVVRAWRTVRAELAGYGAGLSEKPELIGLNKIDAMTPREISARRAALERASGQRPLVLSGATGQGVLDGGAGHGGRPFAQRAHRHVDGAVGPPGHAPA